MGRAKYVVELAEEEVKQHLTATAVVDRDARVVVVGLHRVGASRSGQTWKR